MPPTILLRFLHKERQFTLVMPPGDISIFLFSCTTTLMPKIYLAAFIQIKSRTPLPYFHFISTLLFLRLPIRLITTALLAIQELIDTFTPLA